MKLSQQDVFGGLASEKRYRKQTPNARDWLLLRGLVQRRDVETVSLALTQRITSQKILQPDDVLIQALFGEQIAIKIAGELEAYEPKRIIPGQAIAVFRAHDRHMAEVMRAYLSSDIGQRKLRSASVQVDLSRGRSQPLYKLSIHQLKEIEVPDAEYWMDILTRWDLIQTVQVHFNDFCNAIS